MKSANLAVRLHGLKWTRRGIAAIFAVATIFVATPAHAATSFPNDYFFATGKQWALSGAPASINAPGAWCVSTGTGMVIGHLDTGADFTHPDLEGKLIAGAAFLGGSGSITGQGQEAVRDDNGHGTATAGIAVALTNNRIGVAGAAPDARALVIKVLNQKGEGHSLDIAAAMRWAVDHGAQVINLSIGFDTPIVGEPPDNIPKAIEYAASKGVAVAVASGSTPLPFNPEQIAMIQSQALVVGALASGGDVASYSQNSRGTNLYAPGGDASAGDGESTRVVSTYWSQNSPGGYVFAEGASAASPQAAGVLALLMAKGYSAAQARERILASAPSPNGVPQLDAGRAMGAGPLCGSETAPPIAAVGRPRLVPYRPPATKPNPPAANPANTSPPAVVITEAEAEPALQPQGQKERNLVLPLGPVLWLTAGMAAISLVRSLRNRRRTTTAARSDLDA